MKKSIQLLGLVALFVCVIFMTSCSKDSKKKTCECTVTVTIMGVTQSQTVSGEIEDGNCSDAEDMPEIQEAKNALGGYGSMDISCREI
jgi:hypothetical protein